jgi:hypothetical protein
MVLGRCFRSLLRDVRSIIRGTKINTFEKEKILEIISLCHQKVNEHESKIGYGEDYTDGRIVGGAVVARKILTILQNVEL